LNLFARDASNRDKVKRPCGTCGLLQEPPRLSFLRREKHLPLKAKVALSAKLEATTQLRHTFPMLCPPNCAMF